jgi:DNA replication protein DnaC
MQNSIAEVLPAVMDGIEENTAKAEALSNVVRMRDTVVYDAAWIEAQKQNIRNGTAKRSNELLQIPKRFLGKSLAGYEAKDDFRNVAYRDFLHSNLFLWGPCGTGKTHLSCGLLLNFCADMSDFNPETKTWKRPRARFVSVQEFLFELKSAVGSNESDFSRIKTILELDALVLDDFGASRMTDYTVEMMSVLINEIYLRKLSGVIISSNLSLDEIGQKIDDRTASRIVEMCQVIKLDGNDRRIRVSDR